MTTKILALLALVSTVVGANLLVAHVEPINVGFGQMAPAGVLLAGLAFTFRDALHEAAGRHWLRWVAGAIALGALASWIAGLAFGETFPGGPSVARVALAGAVAFAVSEAADALIYQPLRSRNRLAAVFASGVVGLLVDSALFLWLAFGDLGFFLGQVLGKGYALLAAVVLLAVLGRRR